MSEVDDTEGGDKSADDVEGEASPDETPAASAGVRCLSCGNPVGGAFCAWCGQKNDDCRRSIFVLARDVLEDTFNFDSRMWRTLGLLAVAPGLVPKSYAHGERSRFTPPVRLFLVVSFLFFLTIALTNTLFVGLDVAFEDAVVTTPADAGVVTTASSDECGFNATMRFFVKERDLNTDWERADACLTAFRNRARENTVAAYETANKDMAEEKIAESSELVERIFNGVNWAVTNPRAFNSAFNDWLPRVMFVMAPVLALVLTLFIRGKDVLIFDHLVSSLYVHSAGFAFVGLGLILGQLGVPFMGLVAFVCIAVYYLMTLKRAYGRGWVKTVWTTPMSGLLYLLILLGVVTVIASNIVWRATA